MQALILIVKTLGELYLAAYVLRIVLQWVRADYYNPLAQLVLAVTQPVVAPARRLLPSVAGVDAPTLVVLFGLQCIVTWLLLALDSDTPTVGPLLFLVFVVLGLINLTLWVYTAAILVYVLLRLLGRAYSPIETTLGQIVEPLLSPVRRAIPPVAGFDLSPLIVVIALQAVRLLLPLPAVLM